ncbi:unnamed protein product [Brassica oleracea]
MKEGRECRCYCFWKSIYSRNCNRLWLSHIGLASKLDMHNAYDIRTKGKDLFQPNMESMKGKVEPLRTWVIL